MSGRALGSVNGVLGHFVPERRIYVRSDAGTRYWTVKPASQCAMACVLAACVAWTGMTSYAFIDRAMDGRTAEHRLAAAEQAHDLQLAAMREQQRLLEEELNRSTARGDAITRQLSEKQRLLVDTANSYQVAKAELAGLRTEFEALSAERRKGQAEIGALKEDLVAQRLALADATRQNAAVEQMLSVFSTSIADVIGARDNARRQAEGLDSRVAELKSEVDDWQARQERLLARIEQATGRSIDALDSFLVGADLDVDKLLAQVRRDYTGQGGPYDPLDPEAPGDEAAATAPASEVRVAALMQDLERVSLMRIAVERLPFGLPASGARLTSGFGVRGDPFNRHKSMHEGVDLAAPSGTDIHATADGVVVFSGRMRGYGNIVKIRHAFGFETVYAHLSKRLVEVGQHVQRGMHIAEMGSTGRSTGSHVHYEVRIDGQPVNPDRFMRAAGNVLEKQDGYAAVGGPG